MTEEQDPKIIVDDDWKAQVEKEKEELQKRQAENPDAEDPASQIPPASFPMLVSTLSTQAMATMGFFPDPSGQTNLNLPMAKHFIDTLAVIDEKTKGNLTDEESNMLTETLHQLRMAYVAVAKEADAAEAEPEKKSSIELP